MKLHSSDDEVKLVLPSDFSPCRWLRVFVELCDFENDTCSYTQVTYVTIDLNCMRLAICFQSCATLRMTRVATHTSDLRHRGLELHAFGNLFSELCDFENDMCSYTQVTTDTMDWNYTTGSAHIGLNVDHTNMARTGEVVLTLKCSLYK